MGFVLEAAEQRFRKPWGSAQLLIHVAFISHAGEFDAAIDIAVRHQQVEERLNAGRRTLTERQKRQTATVGAELGNLADGRPKRWTVASAADLEPVATDIALWVRGVGLSALERFASLDELARVLEADGAEARLICPVPDKRAAVRQIRDLQAGSAA